MIFRIMPEGVGGSCIDDEVRVVKVYDDHKAEPDELVEKDNVTTGEVIISSPGQDDIQLLQQP